MADAPPTGPSAHYSGRNRIPNIKQFVEGLDRDKKKRDAAIDADPSVPGGAASATAGGPSVDHVPLPHKPGKNRRVVRDPVTGKDVEIEDISSDHLKAAENPVVCPPPPSPSRQGGCVLTLMV